MSPDLRLHIASLAAVFLALGIGILVGTAFVGQNVVERQTRQLVNLEANVGAWRKEARETARNEEALRGLQPLLIGSQLDGERVLVVRTGDFPEAAEQAVTALKLAGADVVSLTLPPDAWRKRPESEQAESATRLASPLAELAAPEMEWARTDGLVTGDVPTASGTTAPKLIVLIGGEKSPIAESPPSPTPSSRAAVDQTLIRAWVAAGRTVVGAEPLGVPVSSIPVYRGEGIASVDNIDRAAGQIALPYALLGEAGAYGMKPTADRILPESLENPIEPTP